MNPEIWGNLPSDLIERIAHFADIDSRRALGFLPRKIIPPDLDLHVVDFAKAVRLDKNRCGPKASGSTRSWERMDFRPSTNSSSLLIFRLSNDF